MTAAALAALLGLAAARAAEPWVAFEETGERGVPPAFQAWHPEHEADPDYGESWYFLDQADDGGVFFGLVSVTNLGLGTFDGSVDLQYHSSAGERWSVHREVRRDQVSGATDRMDVRVGPARAWGGAGAYHLVVDDPEASVRLDLASDLPAYRFGDGRVLFHADRSAEYAIGIHAPRARASGTCTVGGRTFSLDGTGYHDHSWSTIKLPTFLTRWYSLRLFSERYTLVLHRQVATPRFGGELTFGLLGVDGRIAAASRGFSFAPGPTRRDPASGYPVPTVMDLAWNAGGYAIGGTITEARFLGAEDVLGRVSLPVRMAIRAFYSNPWLLRYVGRYELDVTKDGVTERIAGEAVFEVDYY